MNERERVRDLLGAYVLGHLDGEDLALVEAALVEDALLRREADELRTVAQLMPLVDEDDLAQDAPRDLPPPEGLTEAVLESLGMHAVPAPDEDASSALRAPGRGEAQQPGEGVPPATLRPRGRGEERRSGVDVPVGPAGRRPGRRPDRSSSRVGRVVVPVAAILLVAVVGVGFLLRDGTPEPGLGVVEPMEVEVLVPELQVAARLVPHTWGTEVFLDMTGLVDGEVYLVDLEEHDGRRVSAGTFIGDGELEVVCVMNGAVLREDVAAVVVTTEDGTEVMRSQLAPVDYRSV